MKPAEIMFVLQQLGATGIELKNDKVLCRCLVHHDKSPSAAVLIGMRGVPRYHCLACGHSESLIGLIWRIQMQRKRPLTKALAVYWAAIMGDAEVARDIKRLDYAPLAPRAVERKGASRAERDYVPQVAHQIALGTIPEAPEADDYVFGESDVQRYLWRPPTYMLGRGFDEETLKAWEIRDAPWEHRAVFPIRTWDGKAYGVTRRLYWDGANCWKCSAPRVDDQGKDKYKCECGTRFAKYLHSKGMKRNEVLYGEWLHEPDAIPVLVEGTADAMRLWQHGARRWLHPFALLGAYPGEGQIARLRERVPATTPFVVVRDNDAPTEQHPDGPGAAMFQSLCSQLIALGDKRRVLEIRPASKDAGDMTRREVEQVVKIVWRFACDTSAECQVDLAALNRAGDDSRSNDLQSVATRLD